MATKIVFDYTKMSAAVATIKNLSTQYAAAASEFKTSMTAATSSWEGASKEAFMAFINGPVNTHIGTNVPKMVTGIATLLENNATAMKEADDKVGANMPTSL